MTFAKLPAFSTLSVPAVYINRIVKVGRIGTVDQSLLTCMSPQTLEDAFMALI